MRILCVIDCLGSGGAQRQLVGLANGFKNKGHDVSFLVYHKDDFFYDELKANSIPVFEIIENSYFHRFLKIRKFIRSEKFNVVLSFLETPNLICELAGLPWRKWKLIVGERNANPRILKSFRLIIYRFFHLFADKVVSNSYKNIEFVSKVNPFLRRNKLKVIYNRVNPSFFYEREEKHSFFKNDKFNLTVIARHQNQKNLKGLVKSIDLLTDSQKNKIEIRWYGDRIESPYFDESFIHGTTLIKKLRLDQFNFFPATKNTKAAMEEADAIALFSHYEGFPNVICEAMALGKPVICSNVADIPRFLNYDTCLTFDPSKEEQIANSISYLMSLDKDNLIKLGNINKEIAYQYFNPDNIIEEYCVLFS